MSAEHQKKNVLLVGGGGVGTIGAVNLEAGGLARVSAVLRSNYEAVKEHGYLIESCDHGRLENWRPSEVLPAVPNVEGTDKKFDYIVLATKNLPDVGPSITSIIAPAVTSSHTSIVLIQNGLNIEKRFIEAFPTSPIISGVSLIGSAEPKLGHVVQDDKDRLIISPFKGHSIPQSLVSESAKEFVKIYGAGGKCDCTYDENVEYQRWRKLVYNACLNPICAVTGLDTGRIRLADGGIDGLVRPAMEEIRAAAKAAGVNLPEDVTDTMINIDPLDLYLQPSMLMDEIKGNYLEFENLLGEPLREGKKLGVPMPTLEVIYNLCRAIQWRTKEARGVVKVGPKRSQ